MKVKTTKLRPAQEAEEMKDADIAFRLDAGFLNTVQNSQIKLVRGGAKRAYLWIGSNECFGTLSGEKSLRKLAKAILAELKR